MRPRMTLQLTNWLNTAPILIFVVIVVGVPNLPDWVDVLAVFAIVVRFSMSAWTHRALVLRLRSLESFVQAVREGAPATPLGAADDDSVGGLQRALVDLADTVRHQRHSAAT